MRRISFQFSFFTVLFLVLFPGSSLSQDGSLKFVNFGSREGLSSNIVNAIVKDRFGYLWFATNDGLNKFDGSKFTIYRHTVDDPASIIANDLQTLHEDARGNLWIGCNAGLMRYNRKSDSFENYSAGSDFAVTSISSDSSGKIWVAGYRGLSIVDPETRKVTDLNVADPRYKDALTKPVLRIFRDSKGRMWLGTEAGLFVYDIAARSVRRFVQDKANPQSLPNDHIQSITEDSNGRIWVGTSHGLGMLRPDEKGFLNYFHDPSDRQSLSSNIVYALGSEANGKLWVGTEEGLSIFNPLTGKFLRVERNRRNKYSLVGKAVKAMLVDNNNIFWLATFRGGVNKYDRNLAFFDIIESNAFDPAGLNSGVVTSFAQVEGKGIYVGTDGGGLSVFDIHTGLFKRVPLVNGSEGKGLAILSMDKTQSELWIGTYLQGIFILNPATGAVRQVTKGTGPESISATDVFSLKRDSRGNMWIGTNGRGINYYDPNRREFLRFDKAANDHNTILTNGYIRAIEEDSEGKIWVGSNGLGIAVYNPLTGKSIALNHENSGLPIDNVLSICAAKNGVVWVGTAGEGLAYFDNRTRRFVSYSEKHGLANGLIYKILEDNAGKIWVSTNKGISSFDPVARRFKNYTHHNGLQRSPFVQGAGLKLRDGRLIFGGVDGLNYFDPQQLHSNRIVPRVVLTDLRISNTGIQPSEDGPITEHISIAKEINLDYKQNFSLSFAALNYTNPQENRYMYMLENFDKGWNKVGSVTTASYTNLDPGTYVFKVRAMSEGGEWTTPVASIRIEVKPPFWLTYYAYAFYILAFASLLLYLRHSGIKKLKARFALEQERIQVQQLIEQERREAERVHEFDQLKIKFLTNLSHEFRTPISLITGPVEQLMQVETDGAKSGHLKMIRRNARRLLNLVNQLLDFRNLEVKELQLNASEGDFIAFSREVAESFRDFSERKGIHFHYKSGVKYYFARFDHDKMERVLFNLLSNAFKFTLPGGEVNLSIEREDKSAGLKVMLSDTGVGIENGSEEKIFDRFFQSRTSNAILNQGSGIGLSITREFVKMHGGSIEVESIAGKGTTFILRLPLEDLNESVEQDQDLAEEEGMEAAEPLAEAAVGREATSPLPVILLVEDNEDFRYYLKENLKTFYKIVEASNGSDGWKRVLSAHPQLVVSDISMPKGSGIELCKKIKSDKRTNHIPVLLLTALTGEEDQLMGLETGANDYMTKPFNLSILNIKIRNLLTLNEQFKNTYTRQIKVAAPEVELESGDEKFVTRVIQYIDENLTNPQLSVEDLSKTIGMSRGSLYSKILNLTGSTPVEFIRSVKLDRAAVLLEKSDLNIAQVSYSVGFSTPNYFARAFKSRFNMLPSEYVQLKREDKRHLEPRE